MTNIKLDFNLAAVLDDEGITKYRLHKEADIRPNTITNYYNGDIKKIDIENLEKIINAINRLQNNKKYTVSDIVRTIEEY